MVGYSALMGGVIIPAIVIFGLMLIPFLDREQNGIGSWFTDGPGQEWGIFGFLYGLATTYVCLAIAILFPMRSIFTVDRKPALLRPRQSGDIPTAAIRGHVFVVLKKTSSTRYAAIATFCAFIIAFVILTYTGTALRGPNWDFYWPWQAWPNHPTAL